MFLSEHAISISICQFGGSLYFLCLQSIYCESWRYAGTLEQWLFQVILLINNWLCNLWAVFSNWFFSHMHFLLYRSTLHRVLGNGQERYSVRLLLFHLCLISLQYFSTCWLLGIMFKVLLMNSQQCYFCVWHIHPMFSECRFHFLLNQIMNVLWSVSQPASPKATFPSKTFIFVLLRPLSGKQMFINDFDACIDIQRSNVRHTSPNVTRKHMQSWAFTIKKYECSCRSTLQRKVNW